MCARRRIGAGASDFDETPGHPPLRQRPLKVLLVQSDPSFVDHVHEQLEAVRPSGLMVESSFELSEALGRLARGGIDLMILALDLPDSSGLVTFERANAFAPDVPIVVLTEEHDPGTSVTAVQGGAQDCMAKTEIGGPTLVRAVRHAVERHRLLSALRSLSLIDDLTGLYNRRGFTDLGEQYLKLSRRSGRGVTLVYLDVDRFKTINDTLGHHVGDRALQKVADILRGCFRRSDIIARMGGDEFAVLALESSGETADLVLGRLREAFQEFNLRTREPFHLSASIGLARAEDDARVRLDDLLEKADAAMYAEKRGKRRAVLGSSS